MVINVNLNVIKGNAIAKDKVSFVEHVIEKMILNVIIKKKIFVNYNVKNN